VTITSPRALGALALMAAFAISACGGGGGTSAGPITASAAPGSEAPADLSGTVTIDGSSTVYPITEAVAEEFQLANPGVQVPTSLSGTGGGFKKFCAGETDINDASRPIKADDEGEGLACEANGIEYVELQVAIDGLTVVVNPGNTFASCLTVEELAKIYGPESPQDLKWSDVRADFPAEPINRFMPGADSGTFDYFTEEINGEVDAATQFATQSEDDNVLVTGVAGDVNAIAFFGFAYYVENTDKLKALQVDGGSGCIEPTEATINDNSYSPLSRPLFIYPDTGKAKERPELKTFVDFYLANTNTLSAEVGYIALPDDLLAAEVAEWNTAAGG
jgi:phosphate transport system substrate-binding protein